MIGLGTMGRNLLLNMADKGYDVTGYDKDPHMVDLLQEEGADLKLKGHKSLEALINHLNSPRILMLLVPAGKIVDSVLEELCPLLSPGDLIIDGGNSHFTDTVNRDIALQKKGLHFFGMGISGGELGARFGPSLMPGGDAEAYRHMKPLLENIAAKVKGDPCVSYMGPGAAGHFVKMVHNGIEYALMQLISECYGFMKTVMAYDNKSIAQVFKDWNSGALNSYLLEITSEIFNIKDEFSDADLIDMIKDEAKAKGTGMWTSQIAMELQCPSPSINEAVAQRDLSKFKSLRSALAPKHNLEANPEIKIDIEQLKHLYDFSMRSAYAQGMQLLQQASAAYAYHLNLADIAKIWRGGCIIRAAFLEDIYTAYAKDPELPHLFAAPHIQESLHPLLPNVRKVLSTGILKAYAMPMALSALSYYESLHTLRLPSNLIQAQRDLFGAHTFERIDRAGTFHIEWQKNKP